MTRPQRHLDGRPGLSAVPGLVSETGSCSVRHVGSSCGFLLWTEPGLPPESLARGSPGTCGWLGGCVCCQQTKRWQQPLRPTSPGCLQSRRPWGWKGGSPFSCHPSGLEPPAPRPLPADFTVVGIIQVLTSVFIFPTGLQSFPVRVWPCRAPPNESHSVPGSRACSSWTPAEAGTVVALTA